MPPFVPRKRRQSSSPPAQPLSTSRSSAKKSKPQKPPSKKKKSSLFDAVDSESSTVPTLADNEAFLRQANEEESDDERDDSSNASDLDSDEFEDAMPEPTPKRRKVEKTRSAVKQSPTPKNAGTSQESDEGGDEDEMEWEDATKHPAQPVVSGDLHLTLDEVPQHSVTSFTNPHGQKKGPSKIERQIRTTAHCMHVQCLMYHNFLRNRWLCDEKLQKILVSKIPSWMMKEVAKYKATAGLEEENTDPTPKSTKADTGQSPKRTREDRRKEKSKRREEWQQREERQQRDWGTTATHSDPDKPFLIAGDPTLPFLRILLSFWRKKFNITAPGLRKQGYKDLARLEQEIKSFRNDDHDPEDHGEQIPSIEELHRLASACSGSRDVGAQLFTALLRGIGLEARMVANLQPIGFGWNKAEEAPPPKKRNKSKTANNTNGLAAADTKTKDGLKEKKLPQIRSSNGTKAQPIDLSDDDESGLSSVPESDEDSAPDISCVDPITSSKRYDRDLPYPIYWTEVLSPVSQTWIPLDPIVLSVICGRPEDCNKFEPRGARADRAKQVFAYVVAFSADGSAKDVTVRYLKNHMWPGKTKGVRIPTEKIPIYNRKGKVDRFREYDWFKGVMSCYTRGYAKRTPADDIEESRELVVIKPNRQPKSNNEETLQGYKQSAEFVLERHLRREEALIPNAKQVKTFKTGKGENEKLEPVYYRADVVPCKSNESWHKEGREVQEGEQPLKFVPMRAVTTNRKREIEEAERESGEKQLQGLYARYQTDWIIPPPIENGVIPKNAFGNMDVYVPTMVPKGGVHIPLRGTAKVCRKLGIDHAEACTGFEFGNRMAVPILTGVVVAKENEDAVIDAWEADEAERRRKEQAKREKIALGMWKKMLAGLKVLERVRHEYGDGAELKFESLKLDSKRNKGKKSKSVPKATKKAQKTGHGSSKSAQLAATEDSDTMDMDVGEGGFIRSDIDTEQEPGGFVLENGDKDRSVTPRKSIPLHVTYPQTPVSMDSPQLEDSSEASELESESQASGRHALQQQASSKESTDTADPRHSNGASDVSDDSADNRLEIPKSTKSSSTRAKQRPNGKTSMPQATTSVGRRNASRKSKEAVRSKYFEADSGGNDETE